MLVFGTTALPKFLNDQYGEAFDKWFCELEKIVPDLDASNEAEPQYIGIRLAVDDEWLQDWWKLPSLPHSSLRCAVGPREVVLARVVELPRPVSERLRRARLFWEKLRTASKKCGHVLRRGRLLLVCDWD
jgi:hypothetical protein